MSGRGFLTGRSVLPCASRKSLGRAKRPWKLPPNGATVPSIGSRR